MKAELKEEIWKVRSEKYSNGIDAMLLVARTFTFQLKENFLI